MPKGLGRTDLTLGGVGAVLVVLVVVLGAFAYSKQEHQQRDQREQAAQHQANDSEQQWEALCTPVARNRPLSCVLHPPESEAESQRAERDLRAQEDMANWALLMFFATLVGVVTTIIGLIYVVRAYFINAEATEHAANAARQSKEANDLARAQFVAERRPWISCEVENTSAGATNDAIILHVGFALTNHGQTPAIDVEIRINKVAPFDDDHRSIFEHMTVVERHRQKETGDVVFPSESRPLKLTREFRLQLDDGPPPQVTGWVRYRFEGANRYHLTPFRIVPNVGWQRVNDRITIVRSSAVLDTTGIPPD